MNRKKLSHIGEKGEARMVDVGDKPNSERRAIAAAEVRISREFLQELKENTLKKGDALSAARIAGIQAAKRTSDIIPLCHTLPLTFISVDLTLVDDPPKVHIRAEARTHYKTGVEMEALAAASVAALTIYDMGKAINRAMTIESIRLVEKSGGQSGHWISEDDE
jgi:cyclic pyranopterin phosphate synthase